MPLNASILGRSSEPVTTEVDARWLMAYAAGVGDSQPRYLDTLRPGGIIGHPMFPVCVEWATGQAISPPGPTGLLASEAHRGVHYAHDLELHGRVRPGTRVTTTSEVVSLVSHRAGALMTTRIDAVCDGAPVWTTWMLSLLRGVAIEGGHGATAQPPARPAAPVPDLPSRVIRLQVAATAAHVYTECARIWNPIHTDPEVARRAGLPGVILHGTATLALGVSKVLEMAGSAPEEVRRVCGRFAAMVLMPSEIEVRLLARDGDALHFEVLTEDGGRAVRDGLVITGPPAG